MAAFNIIRDMQRCVRCLECIQVCPQSQPGIPFPVIVPSADRLGPPEIAHAENCIECLLCFSSCRSMAITLENYHAVEQIVVNHNLLRDARKML
ncbi:MAG: 4Fe-4S binding protein [Chloroflexi bacterium]|nr:4Fe-4S binding protein [Chloroflexota bacterium]